MGSATRRHLVRTALAASAAASLLAITVPTGAAWAGQSAAGHGPGHGRGPSHGAVGASQESNGPTGYQLYRNLNGGLPDLTHGAQTKAFSSFDRTGGNGDFNHCQATTASGGCVLAQHSGPGEVVAIWTTSNGGDVTQTGNIHVVLDGQTVLDAPEQAVVDGQVGSPFVYPLVANAQESSGGAYIMVPMPFRQSMKVWTDHDPIYYHVWYKSFADANGVTTFNPADTAPDVIAKLKAAGTQDPKGPLPGATTQTNSFTLAPGASKTLATVRGPGELSALKLQLPQLTGAPTPTYITDDGRAFGRNSSAYDQFTAKIDPNNQGVTLTRRLDAGVGDQVADVYVDGTKVAQWAPLPAQSACNWQNESVTLPASVTAGKSQITIKDQFVSSTNDFNTFNYWVYSTVNGQAVQTDQVDVGPNHTSDETAHSYTINQQTFSGVRTYCYPPSNTSDPQVLASNDILQNVRLRITFDGHQTVDAPLGQFFGSGLGLYPVKSLMYAMDPSTKTMTAWWPMPYRSHATVTLYNGSQQTVTSAQSQVTSARSAHWARALGPTGDAGYFNATSNDQQTTPGQDYQFLQTAGWGKFVGETETMRGPTSRVYLEGDAHVFVDGSRTPQVNGTGTEDFYQGGWYFDNGTFTDPFNGEPAHETQAYGCQQDCTGAYRLTLTDAVPFHSSIRYGIEHGPVDDVPAQYSSTAYWYGRPQEAQVTSDTLSVGNPASEAAHHYTSSDPGTTSTLTATFEGNDGTPQPETHTVRATTSPVSFRMAVSPNSSGVTLNRLSDQQNGYQSAEVYVNGRDAGTWLEPLANPYHRWLDDFFQIPPSLVGSGSRTISVTLVPTSGSPAWSAAQYWTTSGTRPFTDRQPPSQVTGLSATGGSSNQISLTWQPATDNVSVDHYNVYASTTPGFHPGPATLVGTSTATSFTDTGMGLNQTWYFRVAAVDEAGNVGTASEQVSATTGDTLHLEAESLLPPVAATAPAVAQGNCCGVTWSNNAQMWFQNTAPGGYVTLAFDVPTTGTYDLSVVQTMAQDYGINTVSVDGNQVGSSFDAYHSPNVTVSPPIDYGNVTLTAGKHTLTLTVTGHNPASINYFAGLDYLNLRLSQ